MEYKGTYEVFYNQEDDEYGILHFPPLEVDNRVLADVEHKFPGMKVLLSQVKNGQLDKELAAIQTGEYLQNSGADSNKILALFKDVSQKIAQLIAENSATIYEIEWRDMERVMAEVFEIIGFSVELTPGSKDGGKDIILKGVISGVQSTYIVEIKHWRSNNRVGQSIVRDFLNVVINEDRQGGVILSTSGYCNKVFELLSTIDRHKLKLGDKNKIVSLCKTYVKVKSGIWLPSKPLTEILFEQTI